MGNGSNCGLISAEEERVMFVGKRRENCVLSHVLGLIANMVHVVLCISRVEGVRKGIEMFAGLASITILNKMHVNKEIQTRF